MLSQTFEFLRIADVQPSDEKVRKRKQSATDLLAHFDANDGIFILRSPLSAAQVSAASLSIAWGRLASR